MSSAILDRLRALLGGTAVSRDPDGLPRAVPDSVDAVAATLRLADESGWRVRVEGHGSWMPPDAPADFALTTRGTRPHRGGAAPPISSRPSRRVSRWMRSSAGSPPTGCGWRVDPPGRPERTIGSVLATATAGALRAGFGPIRDHVLGCTAVTGDGRIVRPGGTVVKNVAGYDLTRLQVGGFGAFGVLTMLHLRLRTRPDGRNHPSRARAARPPDERRARPARGACEARGPRARLAHGRRGVRLGPRRALRGVHRGGGRRARATPGGTGLTWSDSTASGPTPSGTWPPMPPAARM